MPMTPAQARVVALVLEGLTYTSIAARCGISRRTVCNHVQGAAARLPGQQPARTRLLVYFASRKELDAV